MSGRLNYRKFAVRLAKAVWLRGVKCSFGVGFVRGDELGLIPQRCVVFGFDIVEKNEFR